MRVLAQRVGPVGRHRRGAFVLLVCATTTLGCGKRAAWEVVLPRLASATPTDLQFAVTRNRVPGHPDRTPHLLLRFDGYIANLGPGPFQIRGASPRRVGGQIEMTTTTQRVLERSLTGQQRYVALAPRPGLTLVYEPTSTHRHFHVLHLVEYLLRSADGASVAPVVGKNVVGFCVADEQRVSLDARPRPEYWPSSSSCRRDHPWTRQVTIGLSPGWGDVYVYSQAYQWIDVSTVQPGRYWLREAVDPDHLIRQGPHSGVSAETAVTLPGWRAKPTQVVGAGLQRLSLGAVQFVSHLNGAEQDGRPEYRIVHGPRYGRLSLPVGRWSKSSKVTYAPTNPRRPLTDSFVFAVRDRNRSTRPVSTATVSLTVTAHPRTGIG